MTLLSRTFLATALSGVSMLVCTLLVGCSGPGPATGVPTTTAAVPAPSEPPGVTATRTPVVQGAATFLSDLRQVSSFNGNEFDQGVVGVVGGHDLSRSLRTRFCRNQGQVAMYNLRQPYSTLLATVGLDDRSDPSASVQFTINADDDLVFQEQVGIGQAIGVDVSIRDSTILTLSATLLSGDSSCSAVAIWGEARIVS